MAQQKISNVQDGQLVVLNGDEDAVVYRVVSAGMVKVEVHGVIEDFRGLVLRTQLLEPTYEQLYNALMEVERAEA